MPTANLQHLADSLETIGRKNRGLDLEIFSRRSMRVRVHREGSHVSGSRQSGTEEGTAVRVMDGRKRTVGFAARTGCDLDSIAWSVEQARSNLATSDYRPLPAAWRNAPVQQDEDTVDSLPSTEELESFLETSVDRLRRDAPPKIELRIPRGWVESGVTEESIVNSRGIRAVRIRLRSWSMLELRWKSEGNWYQRPFFSASRGWFDGDLHEPGPLDSLEHAGRELEIPSGAVLLFRPGAAAVLVRALVRGGGFPSGEKVRPAWNLTDMPLMEGGLFGGRFDDTGEPTSPVEMPGGDGYLWRASFRDPPSPLPSNLVVRAGSEPLPRRAIALSDLRIHPLEPGRWALEALGVVLENGEPAAAGGRCIFTASPGDLARRCIAVTGPAVPSHNGVTTPPLLLGVKS